MERMDRSLAALEEERRARIAVALALAHHPWHEEASDEEVDEEIASMGFPVPVGRSALSRLAEQGSVYRGRRGWRLRAAPPTGRALSSVGDGRFPP